MKLLCSTICSDFFWFDLFASILLLFCFYSIIILVDSSQNKNTSVQNKFVFFFCLCLCVRKSSIDWYLINYKKRVNTFFLSLSETSENCKFQRRWRNIPDKSIGTYSYSVNNFSLDCTMKENVFELCVCSFFLVFLFSFH